MMNLYKAGEVDAVYNHTVPIAWLDQITAARRTTWTRPEAAIEYYLFNSPRAPMNDVRVRKAFNMAIDKEALARVQACRQAADRLRARKGSSPAIRSRAGDPFDIARARALLAEAGYRDAQRRVRSLALSRRRRRADLQHGREQPSGRRVRAGAVEAEPRPHRAAEEHGVPDLPGAPQPARVPRRRRGGWIGDYMDPFTFLDLFSTPDGNNGTGWFDPEVRADAEGRQREPDPQQALRRCSQRPKRFMLEAQPIIPLLTPATNWLKKPYVKGMYPNPVTMHPWKYVYIEHDPAKWN